MSPRSRKKKSRFAKSIIKVVEKADLTTDEQISVIALSLKQLGLTEKFNKFVQKPTRSGRKMTCLNKEICLGVLAQK